MRIRPLTWTAALTLLTGSSLASADPRFDVIEPLPGASGSEPLGVTADGCVVVGRSGTEAFRWRDGVSAPLVEAPGENPAVAHAISPDGAWVVGSTKQSEGFQLAVGGTLQTLGCAWGDHYDSYCARSSHAVSADGFVAVGSLVGGPEAHGNHGPYAFVNAPNSAQPVRHLSMPNLGEALALTADGLGVGGWRSSSSGSREAVLWRWWPDVTEQPLGRLPGHTDSEVHALSADGGIAVGRSYWSELSSRAVRWTGSQIVDLGAQTRVAHAVSADGSLVVGDAAFGLEETQGAFVWDAQHGARPLADVLHDAYGLDLGGFQLLSATAVSPDGLTFVGHGVDAQGAPKGWRARLADERCRPDPETVDLLADYTGTPPLDGLQTLAVDSQRRLYVTGLESHNLLRFDTANAGSPPEVLLDFVANPPPGVDPQYEAPYLLGIGPDDAVYLTTNANRQLVRRTETGAEVLVDQSAWPPLGPSSLPTAPRDLAIAADGTLFVAARARVLRIDPDGSQHVLIDATAATALQGEEFDSLEFVALGAAGRVFAPNDRGYLVLAPGSAPAFVRYPGSLSGYGSRSFSRDPSGGFWIGGEALAHVGPDGQLRVLFAMSQIPDGLGGTLSFINAPVGDEHGNAYYLSANPPNLLRLSPSGDVRIVGTAPLAPVYFADDMLYLAYHDGPDSSWFPCPPYYEWDCLVPTPDPPLIHRIVLPGGTACTNGVDDDGDGATDFPADPGCVSTEDEGEHSIRYACDNGVDDDADGAVDFPADPACTSLASSPETTACDDGVDNDGDGAADWDGAGIGAPDPECGGDPLRVIEHPWYCGLGFEVAIVALPISSALRRWRRRRAPERQP